MLVLMYPNKCTQETICCHRGEGWGGYDNRCIPVTEEEGVCHDVTERYKGVAGCLNFLKNRYIIFK